MGKRCELCHLEGPPYRYAVWGPPGGRARLCGVHNQLNEDLGYEDRIHKKCEHTFPDQSTCTTTCCFGPPGGKAQFCRKHAPQDFVDVKHKRCCHPEGCDLYPSYGVPGGSAIHCAAHRLDGEVDRNKRCTADNCQTLACFGRSYGERPLFCSSHKPDTFVNVKKVHCAYRDETGRVCPIWPCFGLPGQQREFCHAHRPDTRYIDVVNPRCVSCELVHVQQKNRPQHIKEARLEDALTFMPGTWIRDTATAGNNCELLRPDFLFKMPDWFIVIECDEDYHQSYARDCELNRQRRICLDLDMRGVFIRFNPDPYPGPDGSRLNPPDFERYEALQDALWHWLEIGFPFDSPELFVTQYLFYPAQ